MRLWSASRNNAKKSDANPSKKIKSIRTNPAGSEYEERKRRYEGKSVKGDFADELKSGYECDAK